MNTPPPVAKLREGSIVYARFRVLFPEVDWNHWMMKHMPQVGVETIDTTLHAIMPGEVHYFDPGELITLSEMAQLARRAR